MNIMPVRIPPQSRTLFATVLLGMAPGCTSEIRTDTGAAFSPEVGELALVTTVSSDYATGSFATVNLDDWSVSDELFLTSGDPGVSVTDDAVFQFNRYGHDNLRRYTPGDWLAPEWEQSLGELSNPREVVRCGDEIFVTLYGRSHIGVYDPDTGISTGSVDLSGQNDGDAIGPEANTLIEKNGRLYSGLHRFDREDNWSPDGGRVVEIDCDTRTVTQSWNVGANTQVYDWPGHNRLLVSAEAFETQETGLYVIDLETRELEFLVATGEENLVDVAAIEQMAMGISLATDYSHYGILCIDLESRSVRSTEETPAFLTSITANSRGEAWISAGLSWIEPSTPTGISVYDISTCSRRSSSLIRFSLNPDSVEFR